MPGIADPAENERLAQGLLNDAKNRAEHDYVVRFIRDVLGRTCYAVDVPKQPTIMPLTRIQHLMTPARAKLLEGVDLWSMMGDLHPTPAVSGTPVGEAKMLIRRIEAYNRGFFAGRMRLRRCCGRWRVQRGIAHRRVRRRDRLRVRRMRHRRR